MYIIHRNLYSVTRVLECEHKTAKGLRIRVQKTIGIRNTKFSIKLRQKLSIFTIFTKKKTQ